LSDHLGSNVGVWTGIYSGLVTHGVVTYMILAGEQPTFSHWLVSYGLGIAALGWLTLPFSAMSGLASIRVLAWLFK
jgi:hypothetical protein